jgi:uncharacterized protein (TIGR02001 family)
MKKTILALSLAALTLPAMAQKAPEPDFTIEGNFGLFSDYRFRGVSQTDKKAALQGGFDIGHSSGFYVGTWGSNVADWANTGGNGMEIDLYGGFSKDVGDINLDIGLLRYMYPGSTTGQNTTEWYVGASYSYFSYKFSRSTTTLFAGGDKGSTYHALSAEYPLNDQVGLYAHYGRTNAKNFAKFSDYKVGVSYSLPNDYSLAFDYVGTSGIDSSEEGDYTSTKKLYGKTVVVSVSKSF